MYCFFDSGMLLQALRVCSPEFFYKEIAKIYEIGKSLKCPKMFLRCLFGQAKRTFYNHVPKAKPEIRNSLVVQQSLYGRTRKNFPQFLRTLI